MKAMLRHIIKTFKLNRLGYLVHIKTQEAMKNNKCPIGVKIGEKILEGIDLNDVTQIGMFSRHEIRVTEGEIVETIDIDWQ